MTKAFLHGRTEAVRSVQPESVEFIKVSYLVCLYHVLYGLMLHGQTFYSEAIPSQKAAALRKACEKHVKLTRECSQGLGQDR
jgi:carnitine O-acetyltransferase